MLMLTILRWHFDGRGNMERFKTLGNFKKTWKVSKCVSISNQNLGFFLANKPTRSNWIERALTCWLVVSSNKPSWYFDNDSKFFIQAILEEEPFLTQILLRCHDDSNLKPVVCNSRSFYTGLDPSLCLSWTFSIFGSWNFLYQFWI